MKNQKGITLISLIIIVVIIIVVILIFLNNNGKVETEIEWGYTPAPEFYELRLAAITSENYGSGKGTLSLASFNTLGRDVKKANGKWFEKNNLNFRSFVFDVYDIEQVTLTDGEHVAIFSFKNGENKVHYRFFDKNQAKSAFLDIKDPFSGSRITIK